MTCLVSGVLGTLYFCLDNDNLLFWSREKGGSSEPNELPLDPPLHTLNFAQVKSMDDNCGEWVECMGVASGCGEQEVGVASGSGWNLWVWLLGVVLRRYIDFLILLIPTPLVSVLFCSSIPTFLFIFLNVFRSCSSTFF